MTNRYAIRLTKAAEKELYGLQLKQFRQIVRKIFSLQTEPRPQDCKELKLMTQLEMEVTKDGKVEIPSEVATAMGWQAGEKLTVQVQDGEVRIFSQAQAVRRAQTWVKSFVVEGRSLSNELIAERRQETLGE